MPASAGHSSGLGLRADDNTDFPTPLRVHDIGLNRQSPLVQIGCDGNAPNVSFRNWFQPDRLPDPRCRGVEDSARLLNLFASPLKTRITGGPDRDDQFILGIRLEQRSDVETERIKPATVTPHFLTINKDSRFPINGAKVQQNFFVGPGWVDGVVLLRYLKGSTIPQFLFGADKFHHTGQRRFHGKRNQNRSRLPRTRLSLSHRLNRVIPLSIQVQPVFPDELRTGILGMSIRRRDLRRPFRHQRGRFRLPLRRQPRQSPKADRRKKELFHERSLSREGREIPKFKRLAERISSKRSNLPVAIVLAYRTG